MYAYRDKVYLHRLNVNCESDFTSNCDHESILVEMDLKTGLHKKLPIYYSPKYNSNTFPSSFLISNMVTLDSLLVFGFVADEHVYSYNLITGITDSFLCKSDFQCQTIMGFSDNRPPERTKEVMNYYMTTSKYSILTYDPYLKVFYRVFSKGQNLINEDSLFNTYLDRKTYVMVLNQQFNCIGEFEIDTKKYNYGIIPSRKGLMIPRRKLVNGNYQYDIFKVNI